MAIGRTAEPFMSRPLVWMGTKRPPDCAGGFLVDMTSDQ
jgi:hypothetical protein